MKEFKFKLLDNVKILPLDELKGQVTSIWIGITEDIQYKVRYFVNSEAKEIYFYEWELRK